MRKLLLRQITQTTNKFSDISIPQIGWTKTIREALGMSAKILAYKLGLKSQRAIYASEEAEQDGGITIKQLSKIANALNCDLKYAFVPREPLDKYLEKKATSIAQEKISRITNSMALENQKPNKEHINFLIDQEKNSLLDSKYLNKIWENEQ